MCCVDAADLQSGAYAQLLQWILIFQIDPRAAMQKQTHLIKVKEQAAKKDISAIQGSLHFGPLGGNVTVAEDRNAHTRAAPTNFLCRLSN